MNLRSLSALCVLAGVLASPAAGSGSSARWFHTPGADGASCELGLHRSAIRPARYVFCLAYHTPQPYRKALAVTMDASARLTVCHGLKCIGNTPDRTPTLKAGHSISLGPFRCTSLRKGGVRCLVTKLGRGFRLGARGLKRV